MDASSEVIFVSFTYIPGMGRDAYRSICYAVSRTSNARRLESSRNRSPARFHVHVRVRVRVRERGSGGGLPSSRQ
jgi:hypothetical protein